MSERRPLEGVRVLDFTWVGAGPLATKVLAYFGAEVIKVESRSRPDTLRRTPPLAPGDDDLERSGYFADRNAGKKSISIDMTRPGSRELVLDLVAHCDIVAQSFRPGTMEKWGIGYDDLVTVKPDLVYLAMPMLGETGPHAQFSGFGATLVALCGLHYLCGYPDRDPVGTGTNYPDHVPNPMHAAFAMIAALVHRKRTGQGQKIELSQLESTLNVIGPAIERAARSMPTGRQGNRLPHAAPHGVFPALGDDRWVAISVLSDDQWRAFVDVAGIEALRAEHFRLAAGRKQHEDELERIISEWTVLSEAESLAARLRTSGVPASAVRTAEDLLAPESDLRARGAFEWIEHPVMGRSVYTAPAARLSRTPGLLGGHAPLLGSDTEAVLSELLGLDTETLRSLRRDGVLA